ncbi:hypothetical protein RRG08_003196, partial [Elysia crispata]
FYWLLKRTKPPAEMWRPSEPTMNAKCARITCPEDGSAASECRLADKSCAYKFGFICEKDPMPLSNHTFIHVSQLDIPESPWCRMTSSRVSSRVECAFHCKFQQRSGLCGAFIYDSTLTEPCVMYSTDSSYTEAITGEQYAQLYIAMPVWRC